MKGKRRGREGGREGRREGGREGEREEGGGIKLEKGLRDRKRCRERDTGVRYRYRWESVCIGGGR